VKKKFDELLELMCRFTCLHRTARSTCGYLQVDAAPDKPASLLDRPLLYEENHHQDTKAPRIRETRRGWALCLGDLVV
jgi:hypothetical protein